MCQRSMSFGHSCFLHCSLPLSLPSLQSKQLLGGSRPHIPAHILPASTHSQLSQRACVSSQPSLSLFQFGAHSHTCALHDTGNTTSVVPMSVEVRTNQKRCGSRKVFGGCEGNAWFTRHDFSPYFPLADKSPRTEAKRLPFGACKFAFKHYVWTVQRHELKGLPMCRRPIPDI